MKVPFGRQTFEFPDGTTQAEINEFMKSDAMSSVRMQEGQHALGMDKEPGFMSNFTGGMLSGITGLADSLGSNPVAALTGGGAMIGNKIAQYGREMAGGTAEAPKFDPYKAMGTTDQPINTLAGAEQVAGQLFMPGKVAAESGLPQKAMETAKGFDPKQATKNMIDYFSPKEHAKNLLKTLGGNNRNQEQVATDINKELQNKYDMHEQNANTYFNHVKQRVSPDEKVFEKVDPLVSMAWDKSKEVISKLKNTGLDVGRLYEKFAGHPNLENTHNLQSDVGLLIGDLKQDKGGTKWRQQISDLNDVYQYLGNGVTDFLKKRDMTSNENLAPKWEKGKELYRNNVEPYLTVQPIRKIVRNRQAQTKDVHNIFGMPGRYDRANKETGEIETGALNKIINEMSPQGKNNILFSKIGGMKLKGEPDKIIGALKDAENEGYSAYFNDEVKRQMKEVEKRVKHKDTLKKAGKVAGIGYLSEELLRRML